MMIRLSIGILVAVSSVAVAQSDAERVAEARHAFDVAHDCRAARRALNQVSAQHQQEPTWVLYSAKTDDCLHDYAEAIRQYRRYNELVPGQPEILEKLGQLNYLQSKELEWRAFLADLTTTQWMTATANVVMPSLAAPTERFRIVKSGADYQLLTVSGDDVRDPGQMVARFAYFKPAGRDDSETTSAGTYYAYFTPVISRLCPAAVAELYKTRGQNGRPPMAMPITVSWRDGQLVLVTPRSDSPAINDNCEIVYERPTERRYKAVRDPSSP